MMNRTELKMEELELVAAGNETTGTEYDFVGIGTDPFLKNFDLMAEDNLFRYKK